MQKPAAKAAKPAAKAAPKARCEGSRESYCKSRGEERQSEAEGKNFFQQGNAQAPLKLHLSLHLREVAAWRR